MNLSPEVLGVFELKVSAGDSFATFLVAMNEMTTEAATIKRQIIMYSMLNPPSMQVWYMKFQRMET